MFSSRAFVELIKTQSATMLFVLFLSPTVFSAAKAQSVLDPSLLAGSCFNCHSSDTKAATSIPVIVGKPEAVLIAQMRAFKGDSVPSGTTIMNRLAKGYSDAEIIALGRYFSTFEVNAVAAGGGKK